MSHFQNESTQIQYYRYIDTKEKIAQITIKNPNKDYELCFLVWSSQVTVRCVQASEYFEDHKSY